MTFVFTKNLLKWNSRENRRSMPWKGEKDPYRIWLSEIILQQTRVEQGLAYYNRFVSEFPTVHQLANASEQKIFKLWEGLGYYSRCRNLISTAKFISSHLNGNFPETYVSIAALPGIGSYTAAAISSFAFNLPYAVVDGNVTRVLSRYFAASAPVNGSGGKKLFSLLAQTLLCGKDPAVFNQAIMDFGAVICKPKQPLCNICIQNRECEAFKHNWIAQLPVKEKPLVKKKRFFNYFLIERNDCVFIRKRTGKDIWQNLYEFVLKEFDPFDQEEERIQKQLTTILGEASGHIIHASEIFRQQLTHQIIEGRFITVKIEEPLRLPDEYELVHTNDLGKYPFPKIIAAWLLQRITL